MRLRKLNFFFKAFATSARIAAAGASYGNFIESAVTAVVIVFAIIHVASYIFIIVDHLIPSESILCKLSGNIQKSIQ